MVEGEKKSSAQLAAARNNHQTRSNRRKDVLNIESELNRLFDLRHQSGRKLSELSFQSRQRYRTNSLDVGYGKFCQERQLAQFNFVATASVLRGERDVDDEDPWWIWIFAGNDDYGTRFGREPEVGQPHFTGLWAHRGYQALPVRQRENAAGLRPRRRQDE